MVSYRRGKVQEAVISFRKALEMDPNNIECLIWAAYVYAFAGKGEAAQILVERSVRLDPLTSVIQGTLGMVPLLEGDFNTALKYFKQSYDMEPDNPLCMVIYAKTLSLDNRYDEANDLFDFVAEKMPNTIFASDALFLKHALQGQKGNAVRAFTQELKNIATMDPQGSWWVAGYYSLIDEKEEALNWLENAVNRGFLHYPCLSEHSPFLENIRGEERFKKLMKRVKKEWENFEV
jgi:tetratricopeptide (TPR) repeat protein